MITVLLYGHLRKQYGKFHRFDIRTPVEAIAALAANFRGFRERLADHEAGYRVVVGRECRDEDTLAYPADDVVRIVPVVAGAGRGWGQVILGAVLVAAAFYTGGATLGAKGLAFSGLAGQAAFGIGTALMMGGVSALLAPAPKTQGPAERPENLPSYGFNGAVNTLAQGNAVAWFYGLGRVGSQVLSVGIDTEQIA